jgi:hypothetical protein
MSEPDKNIDRRRKRGFTRMRTIQRVSAVDSAP